VSAGRGVLAALAFYALLDVTAARLLSTTPLWGPEAVERRYRIAHPVYHHDLAPNVSLTAVWGDIPYPFATNSLGFRDAAVRSVPLRSTHPRLLLIGDSFTEGLGVPFADTYAGRLARELEPCGVEVLNAGVMSYAPSIYARKIEHLLDDRGLSFDFALVAIDLSDIGDEADRYVLDEHRRVVDRTAPGGLRARSFLKEHSLLVHVLDLLWDGLRGRTADPTHYADWTTDAGQFQAYGARGLALAERRMDDLAGVLRRHGIPLAIAVYPYPAQVYRSLRGTKQEASWNQWASSRGAEFFDLYPAFMQSPDAATAVDRYFLKHDVHWSAEGHALVTETLLAEGLADSIARYLPVRTLGGPGCG